MKTYICNVVVMWSAWSNFGRFTVTISMFENSDTISMCVDGRYSIIPFSRKIRAATKI
jgi:hypothetical protein